MPATPLRAKKPTNPDPTPTTRKPSTITVSATRSTSEPKANAQPMAGKLKVEKKPSEKTAVLPEVREELHILANELYQWHLANARAESALITQEQQAQALIFASWSKLAQLQKELAEAELSLAALKLKRDLQFLMQSQDPLLTELASVLPTFSEDYSAVASALEATCNRVPLSGLSLQPEKLLESVSQASGFLESVGKCTQSVDLTSSAEVLQDLADLLEQEATELAALQASLAKYEQLSVFDQSLRIPAIQAKRLENKNS